MHLNSLRGAFDVEIGEKKFPCLINMNAFRLLTENEGIKLNEFEKEMQRNPLGFIPRVLYWGAVNHLERAGKSAKTLPSFSTWAAYTCENEKRLANYAEQVVNCMSPPTDKKDKDKDDPGN